MRTMVVDGGNGIGKEKTMMIDVENLRYVTI